MPIATPLNLHFEKTTPSHIEKIKCYLEISHTLTNLHFKNIFHRDIKPDNLFIIRGKLIIGDFGLVKLPDSKPLTNSGKKLGPTFYIAPEMLDNPDIYDASKADVYSLAKSLWVHLTEQNYPIPGLRLKTQ